MAEAVQENWENYALLGKEKVEENQLEEAITNYEKAIELGCDKPWVYIKLGNVYSETGQFELALERVENAIALDENNVWGYVAAAQILRKEGRIEAALEKCEAGLEVSPGHENLEFLKVNLDKLFSETSLVFERSQPTFDFSKKSFQNNTNAKVSIVISTYNRAKYLEECLDALKYQTYSNFEVIVVNGPSTDHTEEILRKYKEYIKVYSCPDRNLSQSRNTGIINAKGDIVAFIDDDAIAHPKWIERIVSGYVDDRVYGVGGFTFDHTGYNYQCRYTICDRLGNATFPNHLDPVNFLSFKGTFYYPSLLGTNCSFRKDILEQVDGFDEVFAYMLDETDVILKMINLGGRILTVDNAFIFHRYAPSHTRNEEKIPKSYYPSSVSKAYFCLKHRRDENNYSVTNHLEKYKEDLEFSCRWYIDRGKINHKQFIELTTGLYDGLRDGKSKGLYAKGGDGSLSEHTDVGDDFKKFSLTFKKKGKLKICLVSQGYPPKDTSGIARWTYELASEFSQLGHEVHVIANSGDQNTVDYENGVWVHRVCNVHPDDCMLPSPIRVPDSIYSRCQAVYNEVVRTDKIWGIDIVSAPIWDVEGLLCVAHFNKPVITSLHTTYKLALPHKKEWHRNIEYRWRHVEKVIDAEKWLLNNSKLLLANSNQIVTDINNRYSLSLSNREYQVVPHGIQDYGANIKSYEDDKPLKILYVGRIEERKGPDVFLKAALPLLLENPLVSLDLVGDLVSGEKNFVNTMNEIQDQIKEHDLTDRIRFHGYISEEKLLEFYKDCDIFVCPSRYESFGLIVIEAMRFGKPVVASKVGGIKDVINHNIDGLLFEFENYEQLSSILKEMVNDREKLRVLSRKARDSYEEKYTLPKMANSVLDVYRQVLDN